MRLKLFVAFLFFLCSACSSVQSQEFSLTGHDNFEVSYWEYSPVVSKENYRRTVIIFPPTGGVSYLEKSYAKKISKRGVTVKVLNRWSGMETKSISLDLHQKLHERALKAFAIVLKSVDKDHKVSVMGTSLGGLFSSIAANKFEEIERVVVVAAGNPIPKVIAYSEHESMSRLRKKRYKLMSFSSRDDYAEAIDQVFSIDPKDLPPLHENKRLAMVVLKEDKAVPTKYQLGLEKYWSPEKVIHLKAGHLWGIIKTWLFHSDELINFLIE